MKANIGLFQRVPVLRVSVLAPGFLLIAAFLWCAPAFAAKQTFAPKPYAFSPEAQATLKRLATFGTLPVDTWKYHVGDIPHGERPNLDTSDWKSVHLPFTGPKQAVWFRRWVEIPKTVNGYDLTGADLWLNLNLRPSGQIEAILYFNGRRVAMGEGLERQLVFENAKPGDKVLVAIKTMVTADQKQFRSADLQVVFPANRPDPDDLQKELTSAAELLPALPGGADALASREHMLESAADAIDMSALDRGDQAAFDASLKQAQSKLDPLRPLLQQYTIHMDGNAHMDAAWLWPWTETVDVVHRTFLSALQLMNEYPDYVYTQSAAQYYNWMQQKYPDLFHRIQQRVKQGRWEIVGGMWGEPDLNLPDGESTVRELLYGKRYFEKNFGVNVRIGWNPDSFGYNWQLPQIYKKAGVDYFVTQKMSWNDTNQLPLKLFWWQAPDGSRVLTYFPRDYVNYIRPVQMASDLSAALALNPGQDEMLHLYGIGDHGGGPTRDMLDRGIRWMQANQVYPHMEFGPAQTFFDREVKRVNTGDAPVWNYETLAAHETKLPAAPAGKISLPVWNDELYLEFHRGTYTTQAKQKWYMRHSSEWLTNAEKYSSLAWLGGLSYPDKPLTHAWHMVLFNENHDLAAGSGIGVIYKDAAKQFKTVHAIANQTGGRAQRDIDSHIDTAARPGVPVLVWNTMGWTRTGIVQATVQMPKPQPNGISVLDASGKPVLMQVLSENKATNTYRLLLELNDVPSVGYTVLHAVPGARKVATDLKVNGDTMENSILRVKVDSQNGCIDSLYDKQAHFETLASGACDNQLEAFVDTPKEYDAWNIYTDDWKHPIDLTAADSVQVIERGPVRSVVEIKRHWSKSTFVQRIVLYAHLRRVDLVNDVDWHETHKFLKAAFPLAASGPMATYEIPYGTIERPTTRDNSVQDAKWEVPAQRWADLGNGHYGFSLINDSKFGYDAKGNVLRLSLLRSTVDPDPNADRGHQHFRYSLYPHPGSWRDAKTVLHGFDFNYKMHAMQVDAHTGELPPTHSFIAVQPDNLVLTTVKKSEDGNSLILRFYEWAGKKKTTAKITVPPGATQATSANLMEHSEGAPLAMSGGQISDPAGPYSINTIRVDYPNRGANFWQAEK